MNANDFVTLINARFRYKSLYHFTDSSNWDSINSSGLFSKQKLEENGIVPTRAGGDDKSWASDKENGIYNYVSLSFTPQHPMAHICKEDGRHPNQIMISVCPSVLALPTTLICPGMANTKGATFYNAGAYVDQLDYEVWLSDHGKKFIEIKDRVDKMKKVEVLVETQVLRAKILDHWKSG